MQPLVFTLLYLAHSTFLFFHYVFSFFNVAHGMLSCEHITIQCMLNLRIVSILSHTHAVAIGLPYPTDRVPVRTPTRVY